MGCSTKKKKSSVPGGASTEPPVDQFCKLKSSQKKDVFRCSLLKKLPRHNPATPKSRRTRVDAQGGPRSPPSAPLSGPLFLTQG